MADVPTMVEGLEQGDWIAVEAPKEGGHIAYCHPMNAPIISASPDLLKALRRFDVDHNLEEGEETTITVTAEDQRILRAAIAKATATLP